MSLDFRSQAAKMVERSDSDLGFGTAVLVDRIGDTAMQNDFDDSILELEIPDC